MSEPASGVPARGERRPRTVQLPYSAADWATLHAVFPLSEDAWNQMLAVLEAMKPALVTLLDTEADRGPDAAPSEEVTL